MYCTNCGKEVRDGAKFCSHCGFALQKPAPVEEKPAPPEPPAPKKKKSRLVPIIAALCVLILAGGAAMYFAKKPAPAEPMSSEGSEQPETQPQDTTFHGHVYRAFDLDEVKTWDDAKAFCEKQGGHLATIESQEENDFLYSYIRDCGYDTAYFGLSDAEKEGEWKWVTGEKATFTNWYPGEPNNADGGENEAAFYFKDDSGRWFDGKMGTANGGKAFLCEWDRGDKAEAEQETAQPDPALAIYPEYAKVVADYEQRYGRGSSSADMVVGTASLSGLFYINLMDMNGDGTEELILCYFEPDNFTKYVDVWSYNGTEAVQLNQKEIGPGITNCMGTQDGGMGILFSQLDGEWVFVSGFDFQFMPWAQGIARNASHAGSTFELYAVRDGRFEMIHSAEYPQTDGAPTIDGKEVTPEEYNAAVEAWTAVQQVTDVGNISAESDAAARLLADTEAVRQRLGMH